MTERGLPVPPPNRTIESVCVVPFMKGDRSWLVALQILGLSICRLIEECNLTSSAILQSEITNSAMHRQFLVILKSPFCVP